GRGRRPLLVCPGLRGGSCDAGPQRRGALPLGQTLQPNTVRGGGIGTNGLNAAPLRNIIYQISNIWMRPAPKSLGCERWAQTAAGTIWKRRRIGDSFRGA